MHLKPVGIHYHGGTADTAKIKSVFAFFDEILHLSTVAVFVNYLLRLPLIHIVDYKSVHVQQFSVWYNGTQDSDQGSKKEREHGMMQMR